MADSNLNKFKKLLAELFMFDQADLDFGIYRIMNAKRDEITRFLDNDLLPQVRQTLEQLQTGDRAALEDELNKAIEATKLAGFNPDDSPTVKKLREQLAATTDVVALENEVFSDLSNFFRRYYQGGDFLSLRRYKAGVYAIPYEGEEVKLHWANADQYYIKSSEYLRDYTFRLLDERRVHFKLVSADTEQNNNKSMSGQERRFILSGGETITEEDGELIIRFEYRPDANKRKQTELNAEAAERILRNDGFIEWTKALAAPAPTEKNPKRTLLNKHLADYTARYTFDYFIHKDLGGFLRRELDFYIKNEVMHLDDVESEAAPRVEQYLGKIKAIRRIAHKIIDFLAQLENFQKKLWLKKKFVVETNYCVTLDRVPEELYAEIASNDEQRREWVRLFAIDEIKGNLHAPKYKEPLTMEFLKANQFLVLDTRFFSEQFKDRLLANFDDLDEQTDGLMIHSENFQALGLLGTRYNEELKCIYNDPPYNTGEDGFTYKDNYQRSSWLTLIENRYTLAKKLMAPNGVILSSIDDYEVENLITLQRTLFGQKSFIANFIRKRRASSAMSSNLISQDHEYITCFAKPEFDSARGMDKTYAGYSNPDNDPRGDWTLGDLTVGMDKNMRPNQFYTLVNPRTGKQYPANPNRVWGYIPESMQRLIDEDRVFFPDDEVAIRLKLNLSGPMMKRYKANLKSSVNPVSTLIESRFSNVENNDEVEFMYAGLNTESTKELQNIFGSNVFPYAKPTSLSYSLVEQFSYADSFILDFFAGSGTTAHAVINLNREDEGKRKYILVEMGEYFDSVLKPRIQKVVYSKDWKDGKPISREGSSHLFKYIRLESYEDALNNLELKRTEEQGRLLETYPQMREDYMLSYMLDVESLGSASLLNIDLFEDPFNYKLKVSSGGGGETRAINVDLVETFNYLLGLRVKHIDTIRGFKVVEGRNPDNEKVLILWRNVKEKSNADLDDFFQKQGYNTRDMEFDLIYVNGDNNLENLRKPDETWKVRLIEEEFQRLMFDVQDV